ncbi:MAG: MBL fold metallo-hydrolase, partial [Planctomycetota bacterium]
MRWTGVAGFRFDLDERSVAFDPFVTRPGAWRVLFGRARSDEDAVRSRFADLDAVFVGHTHFDHAMDLPAVAAASPRAVIHGSRVTVELCRRLGVPAARLRTVRDGERFAVGPFAVEAVAARHGVVPLVRFVDRIELPAHGVPRTPFRYPRGDVFSWRLTAGDRSFFLQGSAGIHQPALDRQAPADVLVACLAARRGTPRY